MSDTPASVSAAERRRRSAAMEKWNGMPSWLRILLTAGALFGGGLGAFVAEAKTDEKTVPLSQRVDSIEARQDRAAILLQNHIQQHEDHEAYNRQLLEGLAVQACANPRLTKDNILTRLPCAKLNEGGR